MHRILLLILALLTLLALLFNSVSQPEPPKLTPVPALQGQAPDDEEFTTNVLKSTVPVLVDFNAKWCGPCRALKPELEKLTANLNGRLKVYEVDVDTHDDLASYYRATSIPLVILFVGGEPVGGCVGLTNAKELQAMIEPHLPK